MFSSCGAGIVVSVGYNARDPVSLNSYFFKNNTYLFVSLSLRQSDIKVQFSLGGGGAEYIRIVPLASVVDHHVVRRGAVLSRLYESTKPRLYHTHINNSVTHHIFVHMLFKI